MGVVANLIVRIGADIEGFEKKLASAEKAANRQGARLQGIGSSLTAGLTLPLVGAGVAALKFSMDFNKSMANVASLMPGNTARVEELKKGVQALSIQTGKSTSDMAGGLYQVVSAFGDSADTLSILNTNARAATAGLATTEEAINLTSAVTKGYGDTSAKAVAKAADLAQMTVRLGQTTFPELAASIGRVTPLTASLGVSQEELFAVMATGTGVTGKAAEVSTQLRGILQSLMAPTADATKLFKQMGVTSGQALLEQKGLHGAIQALVDAAARSGQPLQKFISSIEGQTLALALSGAQSDTYKQKLGQMGQAQGEVGRAFDAQTKGVNAAGFMFEQLQRRVEVYLQKAGDRLTPAILSAAEAIKPLLKGAEQMVSWFAALPKPVQGTAFALAAVAAAAGPLFYVAGTLVKTYGALAGAALWTSKNLGLSTLAKKAASVQAVGLTGAMRAATTSFLGFAGAAARVTIITGLITALGFALWETAKGVRNLWTAWGEGKFLETLFAKQDDNWLRRAMGLTTTKAPEIKGRSGAAGAPLVIPGLPDGWETGLTGNGAGPGGGGALDDLTESAKKLREEIKALAATFVNNLAPDVTKANQAIAQLTATQRKNPEVVNRIAAAAEDLSSRGARLKGVLLDVWIAQRKWTEGMPAVVTGLEGILGRTTDVLSKLGSTSTGTRGIASLLDERLGAQNQRIRIGGLDQIFKSLPGVGVAIADLAPKVVQPFRDAFKSFGEGLPGLIAGAFQNGRGMAAIGGAIATGLAATFAGNFQSQIAELMKNGKAHTTQFLKDNPNVSVMGGVGVGAGAFLGGYSMGATSGKAKGALGGAASGAMAGAAFGSVVPGIGTALGAVGGGLIGAIGGWFGGRSKDKKDQQALADSRKELLAHFGGLDALKKKAEEVGFSVSTMLSTKNTATFTAEVEKLNKAIEAKQKRWEGVQMAVDGVNARASALLGPLQKQFDAMKEIEDQGKKLEAEFKLKEMALAAQPEFERLGQFATAAFAGIIREGKTAMEAFEAMAPTLDALAAGVTDFGLQGTEAINRLLGMRELVKVHEAEFAALAANQQMLKGFGDAGLMTRDLFVAFGQDTAAQFEKIAAKGGDVSKAMALSQPVLQQLWEGQKKYGLFTDEATSKLLRQAEEQGLVGDHMKNVNEKILDVLIAIGDAFGAKIPEGLRGFKTAADETFGSVVDGGRRAADDLQRQFNGIRARVPIEIQGGAIQFSGRGEGNDYEIDVRGHSYREGTHGRYVDYGTGTLAMLHGRERVMTEAEGRTEAARDAALEHGLRQLAQAQRDLPEQIYQAVKDAAVLGGRV